MLASSLPNKIQLPFANSGSKNTIPVASQIGITAGAASYTDGFPPLTMTPIPSGGVPPSGQDFNGIFNAITAVQQWQSAGGIFKYDLAFSTAIGGYPNGAVLMSTSNKTYWLNLADNNTTDPDSSGAANWTSLAAYGITNITGLAASNVTLTSIQYANRTIVLTGTLTANIQIIFPALQQRWTVINNTTGAFTVTCKTAAGSGAIVTQSSYAEYYGDGTNLVTINAGGTTSYLPTAGGSMTGALNEAQGVNIASGATINLTAATGNYVHITGATGISAITLQQGAQRIVVFDGSLTLSVSASLILPGGANIVTAAGDVAIFVGEASSVVRCVAYIPAGASSTIGVNQTWQNLTASRVVGATYTNTTGKPILVAITTNAAMNTNNNIFNINGVAMAQTGLSSGSNIDVYGNFYMIVPANATYSVTGWNNGGTLTYWSELR